MKTKSIWRKSLRFLLLSLGLVLLYVIVILIYGTVTDWQPEGEEVLTPIQTAKKNILNDSTISLAIWNVGYGGLGEESDFFFDNGGFFTAGGHMVRADEALVKKNVAGMSLFANSTAADIFLLQEVDLSSRRSYYINELDSIRTQLSDYSTSFAPNYKVNRVPIPIFQPWNAYGHVESGIASLSKWQPYEEKRIQFPGKFDWPTRIFQLDRCLLLSRIKTNRSGDLVVINAHLSAYDKGGILKKQQMAYLQELVLAEYEKGNYVIVGADWNQCPPNFQFDSFSPGKTNGYTQSNIAPDFVPDGWHWLYDTSIPTNRKVRNPYKAGETFTTLIDFFLISPNLRALKVKNIDQQFRFSDHQPVWVELGLE